MNEEIYLKVSMCFIKFTEKFNLLKVHLNKLCAEKLFPACSRICIYCET